MRRERNREHARISRERKRQKLEHLQEENDARSGVRLGRGSTFAFDGRRLSAVSRRRASRKTRHSTRVEESPRDARRGIATQALRRKEAVLVDERNRLRERLSHVEHENAQLRAWIRQHRGLDPQVGSPLLAPDGLADRGA